MADAPAGFLDASHIAFGGDDITPQGVGNLCSSPCWTRQMFPTLPNSATARGDLGWRPLRSGNDHAHLGQWGWRDCSFYLSLAPRSRCPDFPKRCNDAYCFPGARPRRLTTEIAEQQMPFLRVWTQTPRNWSDADMPLLRCGWVRDRFPVLGAASLSCLSSSQVSPAADSNQRIIE
jgi:hypothetical protein